MIANEDSQNWLSHCHSLVKNPLQNARVVGLTAVLLVALLYALGRYTPFFAVAFNAVANERDTRALRALRKWYRTRTSFTRPSSRSS